MPEEAAKKKHFSWWRLVLAFAAGVLITFAVSWDRDGRQAEELSPSDTPYESFTRFIESFQAGTDTLAYDYCIATKTERDLISILLAAERAANDFRSDLIATYGDDAWDILNDPDDGPSDGNISLPLFGDTHIDKDKIVCKDDYAIYITGGNSMLKSIRTPDGWLIDASCLIPEGGNAEECLELLRPVPLLIKKYQKVIGYPGIGIVDIDAEFGKDFLAPIFSFDGPRRFDVDAVIARIESNEAGSGDAGAALEGESVSTANRSKAKPEENSVGISHITVGGLRLVTYDDEENGIRPFNHNRGYVVSIVLELSDEILGIESGRLNKAVTDTGMSLVKDPGISFVDLSYDKKVVCFDVDLLVPDDDVRGFKKLSGELGYKTSTGQTFADLGIKTFRAGASGDLYNAKITSAGEAADGWRKGEYDLQLMMDDSECYGDVTFFDEKGQELDVERRGYFSNGQTIKLNFSKLGKFPENGTIKIGVHQGVTHQTLPFELRDISLLGTPL